jgi:hypothetical protein
MAGFRGALARILRRAGRARRLRRPPRGTFPRSTCSRGAGGAAARADRDPGRPCFRGVTFADAFAGDDPLFRHVRTRARSPQTNGVVERFFGTLKYEHIYRATIGDGNALAVEVNLAISGRTHYLTGRS